MTDKNQKAADLKAVQDFIYADDVQETLEAINNHLLPINVLDITGMGSQEIKHSNVLAWLFGDNPHQLGDEILAKFLGVVAAIDGENANDQYLTKLRHYAYFPESARDIEVRREWNNIDVLIEDNANKVFIVIENKVRAAESDDQLSKYEGSVNQHYAEWDRFFIFLTPDGVPIQSEDVEETWLIADYQTIHDIIKDILDLVATAKRDMPDEARMVLESYSDLLIKESVVKNSDLQNLCKKIWTTKDSSGNFKYRVALDILTQNKPNNNGKIYDLIKESLETEFEKIYFLTKPQTKKVFKFQTPEIRHIQENPSAPCDDKFYPAHYFLKFSSEGLFLTFNIHKDVIDEIKSALWNDENCPLKPNSKSVTLSKRNTEGWHDLIEATSFESSKLTSREDFNNMIEAIKQFDGHLSRLLSGSQKI